MSEQSMSNRFPSAPLHMLASRITDGSHFSPPPQEHGYLIANVKDMKSGFIDLSSCTRISTAAYRELKATGCTIRNGNVLLSKDGTVGRVVVYQQDDEIGALSSICIIVPTEEVNSAYLGHALQSEICVRQFENFMSGSALRRLVLRDIRTIEIPVPSVEQQFVIAQIVDTLDTAIRETEALIDKLKAVKQGLLHDLLTRGIDAKGQLRPPQSEAPQLYKESPLGGIPKEWELKPLGHILAESTKNGLYKPSQFHGCGPLMVQMGGLFAGETASFHTATRVQVTPSELNTFGLSEGDLLFARRSLVFEGAGQCVIVRNLPELATFESSIVRVRVQRDEAHPEFVCQFLRGHRSYAQRRTLIRQVAVSGVSGADIRELLIALPSLEEQDWVVERQLKIQMRIDLEMASVAKLKSQKAGLIDDLLTGRVRVTPLLESVRQPVGQMGA
jgi:type I restriction enzyme S subunit